MFTYATEEEVIRAGEGFQYRSYWESVRAIAEEALAEYPHDEEKQYEHVWQSVDGASWIIYTKENLEVLKHSDNDDAYEELGELPTGKGAYAVYQVIAFAAMQADVLAALERLRDERSDEDE